MRFLKSKVTTSRGLYRRGPRKLGRNLAIQKSYKNQINRICGKPPSCKSTSIAPTSSLGVCWSTYRMGAVKYCGMGRGVLFGL